LRAINNLDPWNNPDDEYRIDHYVGEPLPPHSIFTSVGLDESYEYATLDDNAVYVLPEIGCPVVPVEEPKCIEGVNCKRPCHLKSIALKGECPLKVVKYDPSEFDYNYNFK
jgi:hypothetical protein